MLKEQVRTERLLEKSGRITPRMSLDAWESEGLLPRPEHYRTGIIGACPVGALMATQGIHSVSDFEERIEFVDRLASIVGDDYLSGFYPGFDGEEAFRGVSVTANERKGYRDGRRAKRFAEDRYGYKWGQE